MTTRFSPLLFRTVLWVTCLTLLLNSSFVSATDNFGPALPRGAVVLDGAGSPLPLPRNNLLQRPQSRQVVFEELDPVGVGTIIPHSLFYEEDFDLQQQIPRQRQSTPQMAPIIESDRVRFMDNTFIDNSFHGTIISEHPVDTGTFVSGVFPVPFGMGLLDNITLFSDTSTFRTGLGDGAGNLGLSQGINWAAAATPQGAVTVQYGARAGQSDFFADKTRHQLFMTAGLFKRFNFVRVQGGAAVDWLYDRTDQHGLVKLRLLRCELSTRLANGLECGFIGGFNVFQDRPLVPHGGFILRADVHDYYLFFVRKHLNNGGQVELRGGTTAHGDFILSKIGEVAISDRLAVNGGFSVLVPSSGNKYNLANTRQESWMMSMGIVLYFRGGAVFRQVNQHRPMFDVAGNHSFFTRVR